MIKLPSQHQIGDEVRVVFPTSQEEEVVACRAEVIAVHFYEGKVKYDTELKLSPSNSTRIYNVDSVFVIKFPSLEKS